MFLKRNPGPLGEKPSPKPLLLKVSRNLDSMKGSKTQIVPVDVDVEVGNAELGDGEEEGKEAPGAFNYNDDNGEDSDPYEEGSDSDDSVDLGGLVLSKQHEEKKRRKLKRLQDNSKPGKNFAQARQELKERVMKEVLNEVMPDIGQYDVNAPEPDTGKRWYDPLIRIGKIFGLVTLTLHEAVLSGSEPYLERAIEKVHQGKKSNRILLSQYDIRGCTALSLAAKTNQVSMVQMIVHRHADCDVGDMMSGRTPLFFAARIPNYEMVKILIAGGANPSFGDYKNVTPLMIAAFKNDYRSIEIMLDPRKLKGHFVEIDQQDENGWTALHYAVAGCSPKACRVLIKGGADKSVRDNTKRSPWHLAYFKDETNPDGPGKWGEVIVELEDRKAKMFG